MSSRSFYTMCATTFSADGAFDEPAFRLYLKRQIDARLGVYLGSGGNGESHAMTPNELRVMYEIGAEACRGRVPIHANLPEEHTAEATIAQARIAIEAGVEALHLYTVEGRHGYRPTDGELIGYFDDVFAAVQFPVYIAVNPTMGYVPKAAVIAEICRRHAHVIGVRLSHQRDIYLLTLQRLAGRKLDYHCQFGTAAFDPLALGATLFAAEANIIPQTFRLCMDRYAAGRMEEAGAALADIRRFNELIMNYGPCARWIKMCMRILGLPGSGLRKPYLMPPDTEIATFAAALAALRIPEIEALGLAVS